ncbi:MAG: cytochrome b/b6 domain-containing protein [Acidimicrobiaceae bacterium]|nr:cytochrome b/b6 domain-containing protein [Acidimicrobiaceae bacterium]
MVATTRQPERVPRFDRVERALHWTNAILVAILVATAAVLYFEPLVRLVGRRALIEDIHVYTGLALPVPVIASLCGRWGRALRADLRRLNRWTAEDRQWLGATTKGRDHRRWLRERLAIGKFNAGQKLNAAFVAGALLVLLGTGVILRWPNFWPLSWRTGATFVHDYLAVALVVVIVGHMMFALRDPDALGSMVRGWIPRSWARDHASAWLDELD